METYIIYDSYRYNRDIIINNFTNNIVLTEKSLKTKHLSPNEQDSMLSYFLENKLIAKEGEIETKNAVDSTIKKLVETSKVMIESKINDNFSEDNYLVENTPVARKVCKYDIINVIESVICVAKKKNIVLSNHYIKKIFESNYIYKENELKSVIEFFIYSGAIYDINDHQSLRNTFLKLK